MNEEMTTPPTFSIKYKFNHPVSSALIVFMIFILEDLILSISLEEDLSYSIGVFLAAIIGTILVYILLKKTIFRVIIYENKIRFSDFFVNFPNYPLRTIENSKIEYITKGRFYLWISIKEIGKLLKNRIHIFQLPKNELDNLIQALEKVGIEVRK